MGDLAIWDEENMGKSGRTLVAELVRVGAGADNGKLGGLKESLEGSVGGSHCDGVDLIGVGG